MKHFVYSSNQLLELYTIWSLVSGYSVAPCEQFCRVTNHPKRTLHLQNSTHRGRLHPPHPAAPPTPCGPFSFPSPPRTTSATPPGFGPSSPFPPSSSRPPPLLYPPRPLPLFLLFLLFLPPHLLSLRQWRAEIKPRFLRMRTTCAVNFQACQLSTPSLEFRVLLSSFSTSNTWV